LKRIVKRLASFVIESLNSCYIALPWRLYLSCSV